MNDHGIGHQLLKKALRNCAHFAARNSSLRSRLRAQTQSNRGNVAVVFALTLLPLVFLTGMGIDYTSAIQREDELNSYADAAALAAVEPVLMNQSDAQSIKAATDTFNAQASALSNVTYDPHNLTVTVTDNGNRRTVSVNYAAASPNLFSGVLGMTKIALSGGAQATGGGAPNIDFYLLLDDSPSMAIAATQPGINTMVANTQSQGGCAFGCHQSHPSSDNLGNPGGEDNYTLARNLGVTLRIDLLRQATQNLMTTAQQAETTNNASYRMAINTFDANVTSIQTLTSNLSTAQSSSNNIQSLTVYSNNWLTSNTNNSDEDTNYDGAMTNMNSAMPNPGHGSGATGDTPQEVLFFVTDGVEDEKVGGNRQQSLMDPTWCTTIKNRGIRIAVLYTTYLPLPTNAWYNSYIAPFQANIGTTLQNCASPNLYFEVKTGQDISAAMAALFYSALQSSFLSK
jgi:Flp pilus assembly protein TadG